MVKGREGWQEDAKKGSNNNLKENGSFKSAVLVIFGDYDGDGTLSHATKCTAIHQESMTVV